VDPRITAKLTRAMAETMAHLAQLPDGGVAWSDVVAQYDALRALGPLTLEDMSGQAKAASEAARRARP